MRILSIGRQALRIIDARRGLSTATPEGERGMEVREWRAIMALITAHSVHREVHRRFLA